MKNSMFFLLVIFVLCAFLICESEQLPNREKAVPIRMLPIKPGGAGDAQTSGKGSSTTPDEGTVCNMRPETGECLAAFRRYYYNSVMKECMEFVYGGCGGNDNNFQTLEECKQRCSSKKRPATDQKQKPVHVCKMKPETGVCKAAFKRYYYNHNKKQCMEFVYGGCGGNQNNFDTVEKCERRCNKRNAAADPVACPSGEPEQQLCKLQPEVGKCKASFKRYYYDVRAMECMEFIYGGCGGNENRFRTIEACKERCNQQSPTDDDGSPASSSTTSTPATTSQPVNICKMVPQTGKCLAAFKRYFYNSNKNKCQQFTYGGCGGNENNFQTKEECQQACSEIKPTTGSTQVCKMKPKKGKCKDAFRRYYYHPGKKQCRQFTYGGCGGNKNRFRTREECQQKCSRKGQ